MEINMTILLAFFVVLFLPIYTLILIRSFMKNTMQREKLQANAKNSHEMIKLRFQAYERFTLLLERTLPEALIIREQNPQMNCYAFHAHLLKTVRFEFNHNLAMQIYVSPETWEKIKLAKDKLLTLINTSAAKTKPENHCIELGKTIIEGAPNEVNLYFKDAVNAIRVEMEEFFN